MNRNIYYIIAVAVAMFITFLLGKCSDPVIKYKEKPVEIIQLAEGQIKIEKDTIYLAGKSKIIQKIDTFYKFIGGEISEIKQNSYATMDSNIVIKLKINQIDTLNKIDTNYTANLRLFLHNKFRFSDSTFHNMVITDFDTLNFVTKTIIKQIEAEPLHWTRSDWFIYAVGTAGFVGGVYVGANIK